MDKLTDSQKERILETRKAVLHLQEKCDYMFDNLIKDLGYEDFLADWEATVDSENPVGWVFDLVYNVTTYPDTKIYFDAIDRLLAEQNK